MTDDQDADQPGFAPKALPSLVEQGVAFVKALRARADPVKGLLVDKDFIDGLYGEP